MRDIARKRIYENTKYRKLRADWIASNGPCKMCGSIERLEVDHINEGDKIDHNVWSWAEKRRNDELLKCQVLCYICHREKSKAYCSMLFKGKPNVSRRKIADSKFKQATELILKGYSEREACSIAGIARGTYSSAKCMGHRKESFNVPE